MAIYTFDQPGAEVEVGGADSDIFVGSNNNFGAGDQAFGNGGNDLLQYFADTSLTAGATPSIYGVGRLFSAFVLNSVEAMQVTNDSGQTLIFDMSSSTAVNELIVSNSTFSVIFDEVNSLANITLDDQTNSTAANVAVGYDANLTSGANDSVNLLLNGTLGNIVRMGTSTTGTGGAIGQPTNTGIETVRIAVQQANSTIQTLDNASLVNLFFDPAAGNFNATIANIVAPTIRTVTSTSLGGSAVDASAASGAVTFVGGNGNENFTGGIFNDTFNLGNGNNIVHTDFQGVTGNAFNSGVNIAGGGDNTVNTGSGIDLIYAQGHIDVVNTDGGDDTLIDQTSNGAGQTNARVVANLGDGNDSLVAIGGNFNATANAGLVQNDSVQMGAGFDVVFVDAGTTDAQYAQVSSVEGVGIYTVGTTTLGATAQANGVNSIFLGSGSAGNDTVLATAFTTGLSVNLSTSDFVPTPASQQLATAANRIDRFSGIENSTWGGGGNDAVWTGSGVDYFLWRGDGALNDGDDLRAGNQTGAGIPGSPLSTVLGDTLVLEGDTVLTGAGTNGFSGFEFIALESAIGSAYRTSAVVTNGPLSAGTTPGTLGNTYNLTLSLANAPTTGTLTINGSNLMGGIVGVRQDEQVILNATNVTGVGAYMLDVTTGGGADIITLAGVGGLMARVTTQGGNDTVNDGAANADDVIDTGTGNDRVNLLSGNNTVFDAGSETVYEFNVISLGTGNDSVFTRWGSDYIITNGNLTAADTIVDGGGALGFDTIELTGPTADANLAGLNTGGWERLVVTGGNVYTLGSNANRAGFIVIQDDAASNTIDLTTGTFFDRAMQVDLRAGGNDIVLLGDVAPIAGLSVNNAAPPAPSTFDFVGPTVVNSVFPVTQYNPGASGADRTGNANLVLGGLGSQTITGGAGTDVYRVSGTVVLDGTDVFNGGAGYDAIQFDNSGATFIGTVNLTNVTNVELFQILASGDTGPGVDFNGNIVTFTSTAANVVNTLTRVVLDNSQLNDVNAATGASNDSTTFVIAASVLDPDFAFTVFGGASTTILDKQNNGTNNNVNFQGGSGADLFRVSGNDLGGSTIFNGQGGIDQIILTAGAVTDDSYDNVTNVEILTAVGIALNATLGAQAGASGLNRIIGTNINTDTVLLDAAFNAPTLRYDANGGFDNFNATNAQSTITFYETLGNIDINDTFIGGANGADRFVIDATATNTGNLTRVDGVETIDVTSVNGNNLTLTLGQFVNPTTGLTASTIGAGAQTFNFLVNGVGSYAVTISGGTENANTVVNLRNTTGADRITLGSGNDTIYGGGGADEVWGGAGNDAIFGDAGNDRLKGEAGADTIDGGDGDDFIGGGASATAGTFDTLIGGIGNDVIYGGAGSDVILGGAGNDQYLYRTATPSESAFGARDTVTVGTGDVFVFDGSDPDGAGPLVATPFDVVYAGSAANFQDAQSTTIAGDGILQAVFQADQNLLWVDINDDGALNNNDLQINILLEPGVTLTGAMFTNNDAAVTNFDAAFAGPF